MFSMQHLPVDKTNERIAMQWK